MFPHHADSIGNLTRRLEGDRAVQALLLGGSIAHGYAAPDSDIDVVIVISADELAQRNSDNRLHYNNRELCTYPDGYIDGKYVDLDLLRRVAADGSDPARYAFKDARVLFSRLPELPELLAAIVRYPVEENDARLTRFGAQLLAWRWYYGESVRRHSAYLEVLALQKLVLFTCRIVLAANEMLFPFHKWMLREVALAPNRPETLPGDIDLLLSSHSGPLVDSHCRRILEHFGLELELLEEVWPTLFMKDTELAWMQGHGSIDDM